ncbi:oleate hydratase [Streptomyces sp. NPDC058731]|uniref:oleate hydratase n=1 Tax=Streptomyces sp. NPDC058731 TaxID=3346613 RepID=UPI00368F8F74
MLRARPLTRGRGRRRATSPASSSPRTQHDRPLVIPRGAANFAFRGQFTEIRRKSSSPWSTPCATSCTSRVCSASIARSPAAPAEPTRRPPSAYSRPLKPAPVRAVPVSLRRRHPAALQQQWLRPRARN